MENAQLSDALKDIITRCMGLQNLNRAAQYIRADQMMTGVIQKLQHVLKAVVGEKSEDNKDKPVS